MHYEVHNFVKITMDCSKIPVDYIYLELNSRYENDSLDLLRHFCWAVEIQYFSRYACDRSKCQIWLYDCCNIKHEQILSIKFVEERTYDNMKSLSAYLPEL